MSELKGKTKTYLIPGYHVEVVCPAFSKTQLTMQEKPEERRNTSQVAMMIDRQEKKKKELKN
jgi:hypothetical protein